MQSFFLGKLDLLLFFIVLVVFTGRIYTGDELSVSSINPVLRRIMEQNSSEADSSVSTSSRRANRRVIRLRRIIRL